MKKGKALLVVAGIFSVSVSVEIVTNYFHAFPIYKNSLNELPKAVEIGGPFTLVDHAGQTVTQEDFNSRYLLVYFGYTFCSDVCPATLHTMMSAYDKLSPEKRARIVPLFITIDPERDTVERLGDYVSAFHSSLIGLTGKIEQITALATAYKAYFTKVNSEDNKHYLLDHSSIIYLIDPLGHYYTHFGHRISVESLFAKLEDLP